MMWEQGPCVRILNFYVNPIWVASQSQFHVTVRMNQAVCYDFRDDHLGVADDVGSISVEEIVPYEFPG